MGTSRGVITFTDGDQRHFGYQDTSDYVNTGLHIAPDDNSIEFQKPRSPITEQPLLGGVFVDYGKGLSWSAWCSADKSQVLIHLRYANIDDFSEHYSYESDDSGVVHIVETDSGFYVSSDKLMCGSDSACNPVSIEQAEGKLCLACINSYLKL